MKNKYPLLSKNDKRFCFIGVVLKSSISRIITFVTYERHNIFYTEQDANARALRYFYENNKEFRDADKHGTLYEKWRYLRLSYNDKANQLVLDSRIMKLEFAFNTNTQIDRRCFL